MVIRIKKQHANVLANLSDFARENKKLVIIIVSVIFVFFIGLGTILYTANLNKSNKAADNCCNDPSWHPSDGGQCNENEDWNEGWYACQNKACQICKDEGGPTPVSCPATKDGYSCPQHSYNEQCHIPRGDGNCDYYYCDANGNWQPSGSGACASNATPIPTTPGAGGGGGLPADQDEKMCKRFGGQVDESNPDVKAQCDSTGGISCKREGIFYCCYADPNNPNGGTCQSGYVNDIYWEGNTLYNHTSSPITYSVHTQSNSNESCSSGGLTKYVSSGTVPAGGSVTVDFLGNCAQVDPNGGPGKCVDSGCSGEVASETPTSGPTATPTSTPTATPTRAPTPSETILNEASDQQAVCYCLDDGSVKAEVAFKDNAIGECAYRVAKGVWVDGSLQWDYNWRTDVPPGRNPETGSIITVDDTDVVLGGVYSYSIQPWGIGSSGQCGELQGDWSQTEKVKCPTDCGATTATPTPTSTTGTPTPTNQTPTPTPVPGDLFIAKTYTGACTTDNQHYIINYTIKLEYIDDPTQELPPITYDSLVDHLDSKVKSTWVSEISNSGVLSNNTITWASKTLNEGESFVVTYKVNVPSSNFGVFENTAIVSYNDTSKEASVSVSTSCAGQPETGILDNIYGQIAVALGLIVIGLAELKYGFIAKNYKLLVSVKDGSGLKGYFASKHLNDSRNSFEKTVLRKTKSRKRRRK